MQYTSLEQLTTWRRHLHQYPELSLEEFETSAYIRQQLDCMQLTYETPLPTATVVFLNGNSQETVLLRADIDALPIHEQNDIPFRSKNDGVMHACGHDGHVTMLLGALNELRHLQQDGLLEKSVLAVFQPSEETNGGANMLINAYDFSKHTIIGAYALHINPDYPEGVFASRRGELMACCNEFNVKITGKSAHVGLRHQGVNAINAATILFTQFQAIPSFNLDDQHTNIVHVGLFNAGEAVNIVPQQASLSGTIRTYDMNDLAIIKHRMQNIVDGVAQLTNTTISLEFAMGYPPVINDVALVDNAEKAALLSNASFVHQERAYLLGEDFSFFKSVCPINFTFIGTRNEDCQYTSGLHTPTLQFNENALIYGVDYLVNIIQL